MMMKTYMFPLAFLALAACQEGEAAAQKYQNRTVTMTCGAASYTLTSSCIKSADPMRLNQCKPQSLVIDRMGSESRKTLPELSKSETKRIKASGGDIKELFIVAWSCSNIGEAPIAALRYSIGGGSAEYAESWSFYDKTGKLIENDQDVSDDAFKALERNFKKVPSIMPE